MYPDALLRYLLRNKTKAFADTLSVSGVFASTQPQTQHQQR
jgi:hypothetical protein